MYNKSVETAQNRFRNKKKLFNNDPGVLNAELLGEKDQNFMLDVLWVGSHNPDQLIAESISHFRVIFNGLPGESKVVEMRSLRDQLF